MGILRWAQRHLFPFHKTCGVILPFLGTSRSIWHDRPEPLRAHLTHSHINWMWCSRNRCNSPTIYKTCRERQIWNCKAKYGGAEMWRVRSRWGGGLWCVFLRSLSWISWDSSEKRWFMGQFSQLAGYVPFIAFPGDPFPLADCDGKWDPVPEMSGNNRLDLWRLCTLQVWVLRRVIRWTGHTNTGKDTHPPQTHSLHSPQYNLLCLLPRTTFFLSRSMWGLIHWIEADKMDLQKSGAPPFTNVR